MKNYWRLDNLWRKGISLTHSSTDLTGSLTGRPQETYNHVKRQRGSKNILPSWSRRERACKVESATLSNHQISWELTIVRTSNHLPPGVTSSTGDYNSTWYLGGDRYTNYISKLTRVKLNFEYKFNGHSHNNIQGNRPWNENIFIALTDELPLSWSWNILISRKMKNKTVKVNLLLRVF